MTQSPATVPDAVRRPVLRATDVSRSFGATRALVSASVDIDAGEIVAIMGSSGSGKSTFLHCLAGILVPDSGSVLFDGVDISTLSDGPRSALRRKEFGFVFQFGQLVPELSCLENVTLPLILSGMRKRKAVTIALEWLAELDVADQAKKRPGDVSGGQGQRVALARALAPRPRVIFADEPTGALDSLSGEKVMEVLTQAARENNCAVVLVTHEPRVAAWSDREVSVRDGRTFDPFGTAMGAAPAASGAAG